MERASEAFVKQILEDYDGIDFTVLVGSGNNGGDSLAIVRLLYCLDRKVSFYLIENVYLSID